MLVKVKDPRCIFTDFHEENKQRLRFSNTYINM